MNQTPSKYAKSVALLSCSATSNLQIGTGTTSVCACYVASQIMFLFISHFVKQVRLSVV